MLTYTTFKMLHVFGVVLFLGNIIVTGVWKYRADVTGRPDVIAFAQRLVTLTDWVFTFGGAVLGSRGLSRPAAKFPSAIGGLIGSGTCGARSQRSCRCSTFM